MTTWIDGSKNYSIRYDDDSYAVIDGDDDTMVEDGFPDVMEAMSYILSIHNIHVEY